MSYARLEDEAEKQRRRVAALRTDVARDASEIERLEAEVKRLKAELDSEHNSLRRICHAVGVCYCWDYGCEPGPTDEVVRAINEMRRAWGDAHDLRAENEHLRRQLSDVQAAYEAEVCTSTNLMCDDGEAMTLLQVRLENAVRAAKAWKRSAIVGKEVAESVVERLRRRLRRALRGALRARLGEQINRTGHTANNAEGRGDLALAKELWIRCCDLGLRRHALLKGGE